MRYEIDWRPNATEDMLLMFDYIAQNASPWDARNVSQRIFQSVERLREFPRLYAADPRYGDGVRRISVAGQNVLYRVDESGLRVQILAIVGQRQQPRSIQA
ncbi:type II toxin-antitoxin system RelE/ParE family toxin [Vandammella animalimorsus]|uniref:type II toxin-antitoxin system RelE/ParE family toxin n=1 Tax=Vandammella animalimorsus TaxID=2029117 RepID=UPI0031BB1D40